MRASVRVSSRNPADFARIARISFKKHHIRKLPPKWVGFSNAEGEGILTAQKYVQAHISCAHGTHGSVLPPPRRCSAAPDPLRVRIPHGSQAVGFLLSAQQKIASQGMLIFARAEREGFEPSVRFPAHSLSRTAYSTALAPLPKTFCSAKCSGVQPHFHSLF